MLILGLKGLLEIVGVQGRGGGELPYERDGDTRRKIRIKTLKETNLGVARALRRLATVFLALECIF